MEMPNLICPTIWDMDDASSISKYFLSIEYLSHGTYRALNGCNYGRHFQQDYFVMRLEHSLQSISKGTNQQFMHDFETERVGNEFVAEAVSGLWIQPMIFIFRCHSIQNKKSGNDVMPTKWRKKLFRSFSESECVAINVWFHDLENWNESLRIEESIDRCIRTLVH